VPGIPYIAIPEHARAGVVGAAQPVVGDDAERLVAAAETFLLTWHAHGEPVIGAMDWLYDHFLIVAADEQATGVSGCSIDSLFRALKEVERELGVTLLDSSLVWFRGMGGHVAALARAEFRQMVCRGEITEATTVFDNTVGTVGQIRCGEWEPPFGTAWHSRAFTPRAPR
jgi:hypothetical protein